MTDALDRLLEQRRRRVGWSRRVLGIAGAAVVHVGAIAGLFFGPRLFAEPKTPLEFVPVQLMPAPRRGVENPRPPKAAPTPKPEAQSTPAPAPEPEATAAPLPAPTQAPKKDDKPPTAAPTPSRPTAAATPQPTSASPQGPPGTQGMAGGKADSPFTATVGTIEDPTFTYGYYLDRILVLVRGQWDRPSLGSGVEATVHCRILKDGSVVDVRLAVSSGYSSFDLAALRAVQGAAPFPPLPRSYRAGELGINLVFR